LWPLWYRTNYVGRYFRGRLGVATRWLIQSRETSNFTYDLTPLNEAHLAELLAILLNQPSSTLASYIRELHEDRALRDAVGARVLEFGREAGYDPVARFGRRVGWYALVRALKPKVVVETGVEKGLGAVVLCADLLRNKEEGHPGTYFGTDIDPGAGVLFVEPYRSMGAILYGDSIASLQGLDVAIDLFINDSDHSAEYEAREYRVVAPKLSERAFILGDNAHVTDELVKFARESGRSFVFFREEPQDHWYPGAGIGLSFKSTAQAPVAVRGALISADQANEVV